MHTCTLPHTHHAKPASLQGKQRRLKLRLEATLDFTTCQPPPRLPTVKLFCTATACHARAAETCRMSNAGKQLPSRRSPRSGRRLRRQTSPATQLAASRMDDKEVAETRKEHALRRAGWPAAVMMDCVPQARKFVAQERKSSARMTGSRMAFASRG